MIEIRSDCKHFSGVKPCKYHKLYDVKCPDCDFYEPILQRILILKVGEAGEVIRNTPLLRKLKTLYSEYHITWLTKYPELVPEDLVDKVLMYSWENVETLKCQKFDILYSLDKDPPIAALATQIKANKKFGFYLNETGKVMPLNNFAVHKWTTGVFDDIMKTNEKHYVEELFEICGFRFSGEEYILPPFSMPEIGHTKNDTDIIIGLNTGVGIRWKTREWPLEHWKTLVELLLKDSFKVLLLGGPSEDGKNQYISKRTGAYYNGVLPLRQFIGLVNLCDVIVTSVTLCLHVAIGLKKKIVLFNNVFNKSEFFLYNLGLILEPPLECLACYKDSFDKNCPVDNCNSFGSSRYYKKLAKTLIREGKALEFSKLVTTTKNSPPVIT